MSEALKPVPTERQPVVARSSKRLEKRAAMAGATWREFFGDLGLRFLVAAAVVAVVAAIMGLLRLLG